MLAVFDIERYYPKQDILNKKFTPIHGQKEYLG